MRRALEMNPENDTARSQLESLAALP
jgi:hypothetical protein